MRMTIRNMIYHKLAKHGFAVSGLYVPMMYAIVFLLLSSAAFAATVTSTDDSGQGSLRFAVDNAATGEVIDFSVTGIIELTNHIYIDKDLTISGPGQSLLTLKGDGSSRVLGINAAGVVISGLRISGGNAEAGGGIYNYEGDLTLENCAISGNTVATGGGGIMNYQGSLTASNCTVTGNSAEDGAGIYSLAFDAGSTASLDLISSEISQNTSAVSGGGVFNASNGSDGTASVKLTNCNLSDNTAKNGGGIFNMAFTSGSVADLDISGSSFELNKSVGYYENVEENEGKIYGGGAVYSMAKAGGTVTAILADAVFTSNSSGQIGGAVCHQSWGESGSSTLTVTGCTFTGNTANTYNCSQAANPDDCFHYYGGGAILNTAGKAGAKSDAVISNSKFLSNTAKGDGGGLFNGSQYGGTATLKMTDSTVDRNSSAGVWGGGGIFSGAEIDEGGQPTATVEMSGCTLSGNKADEEGCGGGAVRIGGNDSVVTGILTNCTVSGNTASMAGGGIVSGGGDSPANLTLVNCTVTGNTSEDGGGIYAFDPVAMKNTIVAKNIATMDSGNDLSEYEAGLYTSDGNNLIGDSTNSTGFANDVSGDIVGSASSPADPKLGPLQDNGGSTATHALLEDSPAINTGSDTEAPDSDQRGLGREQTDIGAYEYVATEPGNIDGNGTIDLKDAILALKAAAGMQAGTISLNADVNRNQKIGLAEVIFIMRKVSGLR
ncbi:choice-of-anchor Q domain-containing protein [Desulfonema magnum]|uniref:Probable pectate lyase C n=1 Tax=Desulfonema magnum TaxID=45655 RepID=A0A975BGX4_9BACT|nr:choice-of-anchor Q domain-containing protein [Desulfonema magnum]QTA85217.1 dockerin domain-containing protein [Desulfonema magnum]